ncbi:GH18580 [Drosophila grimshawi]|uniref:GH18580 n=2 Tax=Drosophila grimshawi TaxID=7222 RepID=B4JHY5_DROGR|nr:GH18580 [Drosophila grimshawi]
MAHVQLDFSAIPKLYGPENFWHWRMLIHSYLESFDMWKDHPKDCPQAKFIILACIQADKIEPGYDEMSSKQIFKNLEERFRPY